jgi:hypothetical protein
LPVQGDRLQLLDLYPFRPAEKAEIEQEVQHATMKHETTMDHGMGDEARPR